MTNPSKTPLRILVIGAHPADIFDQSGGTMLHHSRRGDWVGCIVLTHGARVHDKVLTDEMFHRERVPDSEELEALIAERSEVKGAEVRQACEMLGVQELIFMGIDDAVLTVEREIVRQVANLIRKTKPDVVITHFPYEAGGVGDPHSMTGRIVMYARELAQAVDLGDTCPPHKVAQIYFFGAGAASVRSSVFSSQGGFYNDVFIDITDVIAEKHAAFNQLDSQGYAGPYARKRVDTSDGAFGNAAGVGYAEGFISLKSTTAYYLPVSELNLEMARLSDHEAISRRSVRYIPEEERGGIATKGNYAAL